MKLFKIYKFRTMVKNAEIILKNNDKLSEYVKNGYKIDANRDELLSFGEFMRSTSIDELPQFLML